MSDYNVLTYAVKEVGEETDIPRCISRVKNVYSHIKEKERDAKENKVQDSKPFSVAEITQEVKQDMIHGQRPSMGNVEEQNFFEK